MVNVNVELFKRTKAENKIAMIKALTENEIWGVTKDTIIRIIKEVGGNHYKSRNKRLSISRDLQKGNHWNSSVEGLDYYVKDKSLYVDCYVQYGDCDTDTNTSEEFGKFFRRNDYRGEIKGSDRYDNPKTYYFIYDTSDKTEVLRSILLTYVEDKERMKKIAKEKKATAK